jgi:hypothetical protein
VHRGKRSGTAFRYSADGKWHCFSCNEKGRGAIDLVKAIRKVGFQEAVDLLAPHVSSANSLSRISSTAQPAQSGSQEQSRRSENSTENPPFKSSYGNYFKPQEWLTERGLKSETLEHYGSWLLRQPVSQVHLQRVCDAEDSMLERWRSSRLSFAQYRASRPETPKYRFPSGFNKQSAFWPR